MISLKYRYDHFLPKIPFQGKDKLPNVACGPFLTWALFSPASPSHTVSQIPYSNDLLSHSLRRKNHPNALLSSIAKLLLSIRSPLYLASLRSLLRVLKVDAPLMYFIACTFLFTTLTSLGCNNTNFSGL